MGIHIFGVKRGDETFLQYQINYIRSVIDYCSNNGIQFIIQTGDFFDQRFSTNNKVLYSVINDVVLYSKAKNIYWNIIVGNHDIYYRDNNTINSPSFLQYVSPDHFHIFNDNCDLQMEGESFLFLSWINKNNKEIQLKAIENSKSKYCIGHLELAGFPMYTGVNAEHGMDGDIFSKFKRVISGHYHCISQRKNITYVGTPYHLTWSDVIDGDNRGFWILDTEDDSLTLHKNSASLFSVINYDKSIKYKEEDFEQYSGRILKVIVEDKGDTRTWKKFLTNLAKSKPIQYDIIDKTILDNKQTKVEIKEEDLKVNTVNVICNYIDDQNIDVDKDNLKILAAGIYQEASLL